MPHLRCPRCSGPSWFRIPGSISVITGDGVGIRHPYQSTVNIHISTVQCTEHSRFSSGLPVIAKVLAARLACTCRTSCDVPARGYILHLGVVEVDNRAVLPDHVDLLNTRDARHWGQRGQKKIPHVQKLSRIPQINIR